MAEVPDNKIEELKKEVRDLKALVDELRQKLGVVSSDLKVTVTAVDLLSFDVKNEAVRQLDGLKEHGSDRPRSDRTGIWLNGKRVGR